MHKLFWSVVGVAVLIIAAFALGVHWSAETYAKPAEFKLAKLYDAAQIHFNGEHGVGWTANDVEFFTEAVLRDNEECGKERARLEKEGKLLEAGKDPYLLECLAGIKNAKTEAARSDWVSQYAVEVQSRYSWRYGVAHPKYIVPAEYCNRWYEVPSPIMDITTGRIDPNSVVERVMLIRAAGECGTTVIIPVRYDAPRGSPVPN